MSAPGCEGRRRVNPPVRRAAPSLQTALDRLLADIRRVDKLIEENEALVDAVDIRIWEEELA